MNRLRRMQALIFDMDGVLWDSNAIHQRAFQAVLEPLGVTVPLYDKLAGMRTDEAISLVLRQAGIPHDSNEIHRLTALKRDQARRLLQLDPPLKPRCREVLTELATRYQLALASSASRGSVDLFLQASQTHSLFRHIISGDEVSVAKPAPDIYIMALQRLGVRPDDAYVIEDSENGIAAAQAAGISVLVFRNPGTQIVAGQQIAAVIDSLDELMVL